MSKKIINDPVYGFVGIPKGIIFKLLEHPYFQRLRRIKQLSLAHLVYPGALHTRFHHAIGALHLMGQAIDVLNSKGIKISKKEAEAVKIAILLHDIGHGPYSHTLEHTLINVNHEALSLLFMEQLNEEFDGKLSMAIEIFKGTYKKPFLHQLVSGQLDMDRMDYLNRDSFFTGVYEGVIGYDRIIKMLSVHEGDLVVEEKGIYSIEKFLIARRLMYWQVYLHKTVLSAELMLIELFKRARQLVQSGGDLKSPNSLKFLLENSFTIEDFKANPKELLPQFATLDDHDIAYATKFWANSDDPIISWLAKSLIQRNIFRLRYSIEPFKEGELQQIRTRLLKKSKFPAEDTLDLLKTGFEQNSAYKSSSEEIKILFKKGGVIPLSQTSDLGITAGTFKKHYVWYPKNF